MATYTDNYQLTKPTYAEQADIGVINSNMNKIDDVMHSSQISLAPAYDSTQTYAEGDVVMYELLMYKCISPTTGVWDASKWERTTASESGGGGSAELDILGEASGAVASFADGASAGLAKCIADINPVQDLHGYSKPWAGGAGKNKLAVTTSLPTTINGITFAWNDDGTLNVSGQASGEVFLWFNGGTGIILEDNTAYTMSVEGLANSQRIEVQLCERETSGSGLTYDFSRNADGNGNFTTKSGWYMRDARIHISSGADFRIPLNLKMMVELGSTATTFEPYSNICPISGHSSVTINVSPTNDTSQGVDTTIQLGGTYYGGTLNVGKGELAVTYGYIASYNGETLTGEWLSDRDEYTIGGTPTTGSEVVYELATPITVQLTPQEVNSLLGQNNISADTGDIDIVYVKASAPIQPNPTGTPTATLSKLGIEGTVFEIPSGGGGSSSEVIITGQERVVGTYNNKPLYQLDIQADDITGNVNIIQAPTSIGRLVSYKGCAYDRTNDQYVALPIYATSSYYMRLYIYGGYIYMEMPTSIRIDVSISLRYTKITD